MNEVPEGKTIVFLGYGGTDKDYETLCYSYEGIEIRIPVRPDVFLPEEVEKEYGCISAATLAEAIDYVDEMLEEMRAE